MKIWDKWRASLLVGLVFLCVTFAVFSFYNARTLKGNIDNHILSSEMFGLPDAVRAKGLTPLYGPKDSGWDGQFYYYMSNDILGRKDTPKHIDAPSYRYQRIGLSLYVAVVSKLMLQDWVSPTLFFFSYLALIATATVAGARLLQRFGAHPALVLLWSFSIGTQITLFNALPDAAADAFLIIALSLLLSGRIAWSAIPFAFAALSREVYAVFPSAVLAFAFLHALRGNEVDAAGKRLGQFAARHAALLVPGLVAVGWNRYVTLHFGVSPSSQAHGILGRPLGAWSDSLAAALTARANGAEFAEGTGSAMILALFLLVLVGVLWTAAKSMRLASGPLQPYVRGIAASSAFFAVLYACFGPTVTGHYTGYFKAIAVFFFLIPLLVAMTGSGARSKYVLYSLLLASLLLTSYVNLEKRILISPTNEDKYTRMSTLTEDKRVECFGTYDAKISVNKVTMLKASPWSGLFGRRDQLVINVALTNTGAVPLVSSRAFGSVFMSYHWNDASGKTVVDGIRSVLPAAVQPGDTVNVDVFSPVPSQAGLSLRLSPVQEGCAWFYQANPKVGSEFAFTVDN